MHTITSPPTLVVPWLLKVLDGEKSSHASDVYSLGIVLWEIVSREVPWQSISKVRDIVLLVVVKGDRPEIPADTPFDIAKLMRACWVEEPRERPTSAEIFASMKQGGSGGELIEVRHLP